MIHYTSIEGINHLYFYIEHKLLKLSSKNVQMMSESWENSIHIYAEGIKIMNVPLLFNHFLFWKMDSQSYHMYVEIGKPIGHKWDSRENGFLPQKQL